MSQHTVLPLPSGQLTTSRQAHRQDFGPCPVHPSLRTINPPLDVPTPIDLQSARDAVAWERAEAMAAAGCRSVQEILRKGGMVLHRAARECN